MAFRFRLETVDGRPGEPAQLTSTVPDWRGDRPLLPTPGVCRVASVSAAFRRPLSG